MSSGNATRKLRSQQWFDNPDNPGMTALYMERYLNYGLTRKELQSGKPIIGIAQTGSDLSPCNRHHLVLAERVRTALDRLGFLLVPTTFAFLLLGDAFVAMIFQGGRFGPTSTAATYAVLAAYTLGLPASAASRTLSSSFYALRDTRTPARIAAVRVVLSAGVGIALMGPFDRLTVGPAESVLHLGAVGLAVGAAVGAWLEYGLLRRQLRTRIGAHGPARGRRIRRWVAGLAAALVALAAKGLLGSLVPHRGGWIVDAFPPDSRAAALLLGLGTAGLFGGAYLGAARLLGVGASPAAFLRRRR